MADPEDPTVAAATALQQAVSQLRALGLVSVLTKAWNAADAAAQEMPILDLEYLDTKRKEADAMVVAALRAVADLLEGGKL